MMKQLLSLSCLLAVVVSASVLCDLAFFLLCGVSKDVGSVELQLFDALLDVVQRSEGHTHRFLTADAGRLTSP